MAVVNRSLQKKLSGALLVAAILLAGFYERPSLLPVAAAANGGTYTVKFPVNVRLAILHVIVPHEYDPHVKTAQVEARGTIALPYNCDIHINLCYDGQQNMQYFEQLNANSVTRLMAAQLELDDSGLSHLKKFKNMKSLNLSGTLITDKSLPLLGTYTNLTALRLENTDITGSGFASLAGLHYLFGLNINGINLKPGSLASLKPLAACLNDLNCSRVNLSEADMQSISTFKLLNNLDMDGNKAIGNNCVKYLLPLKKLERINIADTSINEKSLEELYKIPALRKVKIRGHQFWLGGVPKKTRPPIIFEDQETTSNRVPIDMFSPLH